MRHFLDFEKPIAELEGKIEELRRTTDAGGIDDAEVDAERRGADLWLDLPAAPGKGGGHGLFKGAAKVAQAAAVGFCQCTRAAFGEFKEVLEVAHADRLSARQIHLLRAEAGEHAQIVTRACNGHVETALAALAVERAEIHGQLASWVRAVRDGKIDEIAFVALHALQVLDEQRFQFALGEVGLQSRILPSGVVE